MKLQWVFCGFMAVWLASSAAAQEAAPVVVPATFLHGKPRPPKVTVSPQDCPPGVVPPGTDPANPGMSPADPLLPPGVSDPSARAPETGTLAAASFNPNMFGDLFGTRAASVSVLQSRLFLQTLQSPGGGAQAYFGSVGGSVLSPAGPVVVTDNGGRSASFTTNFNTVGAIPNAGNAFVNANAQVTRALQGLNPGATVVFLQNQSFAQGGAAGMGPGSTRNFVILQGYQITTSLTDSLNVPSAGGTVGKTKLSDDSSPLPRDRFIFSYDFFAKTALVPGGYDVSRFSPGFEKTFFNGRASAEVRFPFASTLDSTSSFDGLSNRATEFGDINLTLKGLIFSGSAVNVSTGLGISFPTADDAVLRGSDGADLLRIKNEAYTLTPFIAALFTPNDRLFGQAWMQFSFDATGSKVLVAQQGGGLGGVGRLYDQSLMQIDGQLGYWIYRSQNSALRGLAPYVELHYNTPINTGKAVQTGAFAVGGGGQFDELNLSAGVTAQVGTNLLVTVGAAVPLRSGTDKFFDYQIGARASWFFGATARAREGAEASAAGGGYGSSDLARDYAPAALPSGAAVGSPSQNPAVSPDAIAEAPVADPFARAPETGTLAAATFNPNFFGDLIGVSRTGRLIDGAGNPIVRIPVLPRYNGLKVTDNDNPRPQDRFFFSYNGYSAVNKSVNPASVPDIHLNREIIGLEKTFLDGDASVGLRLPFIQTGGAAAFEAQDIGDLSIVTKWALVNDPRTGNVITAGLTVTVPTGGRGENLSILDDGSVAPRAVFLQPWGGAVWNRGDWFVQAVSSLVVPTDDVFPTVFFNSVGVGYWLYRNCNDRLVRGIVPVAEIHVNTPLTGRSANAPIFFRDQANLTTGLQLVFPRMTVGGSVCVPLVGPRPYDIEAMGTINFQF